MRLTPYKSKNVILYFIYVYPFLIDPHRPFSIITFLSRHSRKKSDIYLCPVEASYTIFGSITVAKYPLPTRDDAEE